MTLLAPRPPQSTRKLILLLPPTNLLILGPLFDSRAIDLDGGYPRIMIAFGFIESRLGFSDRPFTPLAVLGLCGELRPALGLAPLLLPLKIQCSFPGSLFTDFRRRPIFRFRPPTFAATLGFVANGKIGMLCEATARSRRPPEDDARLSHRCGDHVRVVRLSGNALMKEVATRAPSLQGRLHRGGCDREIEEAK